jgi:hypothetical protein
MAAPARIYQDQKLSIDDELDLIRRAKTDHKAMTELITYYAPYARQQAEKIAAFTGASQYKDDMTHEALIVLQQKVHAYDFEYIAKRKREDPAYTPATLSSYAYREMRRSMLQLACNTLESVRVSLNSDIQKAHRELDAGEDPEVVAERNGLPVETVRRLERHTISFDDWIRDNPDALWSEDETENNMESLELQQDVFFCCWMPLTARQKQILMLIRQKFSPDTRAMILGCSRQQLYFEELKARQRFVRLSKERLGMK